MAWTIQFSPITGELTTIAASTWRFDGNSGTVLVSSGFPLRPGQVTSAKLGNVRVYVDGVEQAVAVDPLRGTFPDGSYRSIGIQFNYNLTNVVPVTSSVVIGTDARGTTDLAWTTVTYAIARTKAVIAPTDPVHLCNTMVTLMPLTPATNDAGPGPAWNTAFETAWNTAGIADATNPGTAIYDHVNALLAYYCRTGTRSWYQYAWDWATALAGDMATDLQTLAYTLPTSPTASCTNNAIWNPEDIIGVNGSCGTMNEAYSMRHVTNAVSYWLTAWRQPIRAANVYAGDSLWRAEDAGGYVPTRDNWISETHGMRFNAATVRLWPVLIGYLVESTTPFETPSGSSVGTFLYPSWLPWTIDALVYWAFTTTDYRDGLVGMRSAADDTLGPGIFPNFQLPLIAHYLMCYYDNVLDDSRIPGLLKIIADYAITQMRASVSGEGGFPDSWVTPYASTATVPSSGLDPWYMPQFASIFGWVYANTGDTTYSTWLDRCIEDANVNPSHLVMQTKLIGEIWGHLHMSYAYYRNGGTIRGIAGAHPTAITTPTVHASLG